MILNILICDVVYNMEAYLKSHLESRYLNRDTLLPGLAKYSSRHGWTDYYLGENLIFSHRDTSYSLGGFPDKLHSHNFYEMDIYQAGNISYIANNHEIFPQKDNILLFPPGTYHTGRMSATGRYERYVFYFSAELFDFLDSQCLPNIFKSNAVTCLEIDPAKKCELYYLLNKIEYTLHQNDGSASLLAFAYIMQLFHLVGMSTALNTDNVCAIPPNILDIKTYIDENFMDLNSASEIADHVFYSREHITRVFKLYFNTTVSEYLINRKLSCAKKVLEEGGSVTSALHTSGYRSVSSFVSTFKKHTSMTPSEYKKTHNR